jgi:peptidoglycan/LPS O-acetylase OafA/YrhL
MGLQHILARPPSVIWGFAVLGAIIGFGWLVWATSPFYREKTGNAGGKYGTLDGLRGLLASSVFVAHASSDWVMHLTGSWAPPSDGYNAFGRSSVWLFFCITAFLFWGKVLDGHLKLGHHVRSRILRICPLYVFMALAASTIILVCSGWTPGAPHISALEWGRLYSFGILTVTPDHIHLTPSAVTIGLMWTLQCEWAFYFVLPMIAFCRSFKRWVVLAIVAMVLMAPKMSPLPAQFTIVYRSPIGSFLIGMLAAYVVRQKPAVLSLLKQSRGASLFVLAATVGSSFLIHNQPALLTMVVLPIFLIVISGNNIFGLLTNRATKTLGIMSYSIYLLHPLVLYLSRPFGSLAVHSSHPTLAYWSLIFGLGGTLVAISATTYRFIEFPFIELERRFRGPVAPRPQPAGAPLWSKPESLLPDALATAG